MTDNEVDGRFNGIEGIPGPNPPILLDYQTICNSLEGIIGQHGAITAFAANELFYVVGTISGVIYVLDLAGNASSSWKVHTAAVTSLIIDSNGDSVISGGQDCRCCTHSLVGQQNSSVELRSPVKALAADGSSVFVGMQDGSLAMIRRRQWIGTREVIVYRSSYPVEALSLSGPLLAVGQRDGVRVFNVQEETRVIELTEGFNPEESEALPPCLRWLPDDGQATLLITYGRTVQMLTAASCITARIQLDEGVTIIGGAPFEREILLLLSDAAGSSVMVVTRTGRVIMHETLEGECPLQLAVSPAVVTRCSEADDLRDYFYPPPREATDLVYYIVSPRRLVAASRCSLLQYLQILVNSGLFEDAISVGENSLSVSTDQLRVIGQHYILLLINQGQYARAAEACARYLTMDSGLWLRFLFVFAQAGALDVLAPLLPVRDPQLPGVVYDTVLAHFLETRPDLVLELVTQWPVTIYNAQAVAQRALEVAAGQSDALVRAAFTIYDRVGDTTAAFLALLSASAPDVDAVFDYVHAHPLGVAVAARARELFRLSPERAVTVFAHVTELLPVNFVLDLIIGSFGDSSQRERQQILYAYLSTVQRDDPQALAPEHLDLLVSLTADVDPDALYGLIDTAHLQLQTALTICRERGLLAQQVAVLRHIGTEPAHREATEILVAGLHDVAGVLDYIFSLDDKYWSLLLYLVSQPETFLPYPPPDCPTDEELQQAYRDWIEFLTQLFRQAGSRVHPAHCAHLLTQLPPDLEIPGLQELLTTIVQQCRLQVSLRKTGNAVIQEEGAVMSQRAFTMRRPGCILRPDSQCSLCGLRVWDGVEESFSPLLSRRLVCFRCGHTFHSDCLVRRIGHDIEVLERIECPACLSKLQSALN